LLQQAIKAVRIDTVNKYRHKKRRHIEQCVGLVQMREEIY